MSNEAAAMILQITLFRMQASPDALLPPPEIFHNVSKMKDFERSFGYFAKSVRKEVEEKMGASALSLQMKVTHLRRALGPSVTKLYEEQYTLLSDARSLVWRYAPFIRIEGFLRYFHRYAEEIRLRYPFLHNFVENEHHLIHIKNLIPILEWHRVLLDFVPSNEITRDEARSITNDDVIHRIKDESERQNALHIFQRFCDAFNMSFPLVEYIHECQRNPFLTPEGDVDVGGQMSLRTPIAFSLPSLPRGEGDAAGLCTVQLMLRLHRMHEDLLAFAIPAGSNADRHANSSFLISPATPPSLLHQKLLTYDRERHLIPVLNVCAHQPLTATHTADSQTSHTFDFKQMDGRLKHSLLRGKQSVQLQIRHYQYRGEVRISGKINAFRRRIDQEDLPKAVVKQIVKELSSPDRVTRLLSQIEICISYLADLGGESVRSLKMESMSLRYERMLVFGYLGVVSLDTFLSLTLSFSPIFFQKALHPRCSPHRP